MSYAESVVNPAQVLNDVVRKRNVASFSYAYANLQGDGLGDATGATGKLFAHSALGYFPGGITVRESNTPFAWAQSAECTLLINDVTRSIVGNMAITHDSEQEDLRKYPDHSLIVRPSEYLIAAALGEVDAPLAVIGFNSPTSDRVVARSPDHFAVLYYSTLVTPREALYCIKFALLERLNYLGLISMTSRDERPFSS